VSQEHGSPRVCVDLAEPSSGTRVVDALPDACDCGGDLLRGFGLAGGGMGHYALCVACDVMFKVMIPKGQG